MTLPEFFGYIASALVLATFSMRTMVPLRLVGISSNVAFIIYGVLGSLVPVVILHAILLPLNVYRLAEMRRLVREINEASDNTQGLTAFLPFMQSVSVPAGTTLFQKGDLADAMYVLTAGRIRFPELNTEIGPGDLLGEVGIFSPGGVRMASAVCLQGCTLQRITRERVRELVFQNPRIGFHLIGVVTKRLLEDLRPPEASGGNGGPVGDPRDGER